MDAIEDPRHDPDDASLLGLLYVQPWHGSVDGSRESSQHLSRGSSWQLLRIGLGALTLCLVAAASVWSAFPAGAASVVGGQVSVQRIVDLQQVDLQAQWQDSNNRCLAAAMDGGGDGPGPGTVVLLSTCNPVDGKQRFVKMADGLLQWKMHPGYCVTAGASVNGEQDILLYDCSPFNKHQEWKVEKGLLSPASDPGRCVAESMGEAVRATLGACRKSSKHEDTSTAPTREPREPATMVFTTAQPTATAEDTSTAPTREPREPATMVFTTAQPTATAEEKVTPQATMAPPSPTTSPAKTSPQGSGQPSPFDRMPSLGWRNTTPAAKPAPGEEKRRHKVPAAKAPTERRPLPAVLGANCSTTGENCRHTGLCCVQGTRCYLRDNDFGICRSVCESDLGWSCRKVGMRSPQKTPGAWAGEECTLTKRCNNQALMCFQKNASFAICTQKTPPGYDAVPVGGSQEEYTVMPASSAAEEAGTKLYCFMAVLPGSNEEGLRVEAEKRSTSIFACEAHSVFPSLEAKEVHIGTWNSFANTDSFIQVWARVFKQGDYKKCDWTVKVDPDSVFLPDRLRKHLADLHAPSNKPIYIKNTLKNFGFLGALEVISNVATQNLVESYKDCRRTMPGTSGEDGFLKACLDAIGAGSMTDVGTLRTPNDMGDCVDWTRVVFHPHKDPEDWGRCFETATR